MKYLGFWPVGLLGFCPSIMSPYSPISRTAQEGKNRRNHSSKTLSALQIDAMHGNPKYMRNLGLAIIALLIFGVLFLGQKEQEVQSTATETSELTVSDSVTKVQASSTRIEPETDSSETIQKKK